MSMDDRFNQWFSENPEEGEYDARVESVCASDNSTHAKVRESFPGDDDVDTGERMKMHLEIARSHIAAYEHEKGCRLNRAQVIAILLHLGYWRED